MKFHNVLMVIWAGLAVITRVGTAETTSPVSHYFQDGEVRIVSSSHQDTGWMDTPAACRQFRVEHNIMPAMEMMRKDPNYTFCMECTLHVMEFLEAHPELRGEVIQRMKEGRLEFGATYNQPYESWFSGEDLIRETYFGRRWIKTNLPGCDAKVAFNPDPPARSLQMQQILAKAGITYMFISRYHEGLYRWLSPDGTGVLLYTPGHYGNHLGFLNGAPAHCSNAISRKLKQEGPYYEKRHIPPVYSLVNSMDFSRPVSFSPLISFWNGQGGAQGGEKQPLMKYSSIRGFFEAIDKPAANFDTLMGERPDVWAYITGPTHHWTASVKREAARLLPAAETFTTMACLLKGSFADWPAKALDQAWMDEIYIDHGIGGKNGHITDEVFFRKVDNARNTGRTILDKSLADIASQVQVKPSRGTPVVLFNDLSWTRSGIVEMTLPPTVTGGIRVVDGAGREVASQITTAGESDETNVAAASMGSTATADSAFNTDYGAEKAINGKWAVRDPDPALGTSDKWNSAAGAGSHCLTIDFGQSRTIHKVVIRHEGVMGGCGEETQANTADLQIQGANAPQGPWTDLVAPVVGNTSSLTAHTFDPRTVRYLRLNITKGSLNDSYARIYEVEAFTKADPPKRLVFVASDVPALGYKTYYYSSGGASASKPDQNTSPEVMESPYYKITLCPGGIKSIFDKQQKREWLKTDRFLGGEVFTLLSVAPNNRGAGTDAGEFGAVPMPVMDGSFDRVADHKPAWRIVETGALRTVCQLEQPLADTKVIQRVILWHTIKRVDCEVELKEFNGHLWREFRMALPLAMDKPRLVYEVPMGTVEIGKDEIPTTGGHAYGGLNYWQQCRDIRPRLVQDFVDASDGAGGLTMSSSVSAFDWVDPTTNGVVNPVIQPILLASRKSCNGQGNWYPQAGNHSFRFSLTSHEGGWQNGRKDGIGANHPLFPVVVKAPGEGSLPAERSFASVSTDNVIVSTIKKCEDDNSMVVRLYDMDGRDSQPTVTLFKPIVKAEQTNIIEQEGKPLQVKSGAVEMKVGHHAIETIKCVTKIQKRSGRDDR